MKLLETFLEILKYTIPALIVFVTVYYIIKRFLDQQYGLESLKYKQEQMNISLPLKLQAYERLAVLCQRISLDHLALRLNVGESDSQALGTAMLLAIQQEFDHNIGQQVYVSNKLWDIITATKNTMQTIISDAMLATKGKSAQELIDKAMKIQGELGNNPTRTAIKAIKKEMDIML